MFWVQIYYNQLQQNFWMGKVKHIGGFWWLGLITELLIVIENAESSHINSYAMLYLIVVQINNWKNTTMWAQRHVCPFFLGEYQRAHQLARPCWIGDRKDVCPRIGSQSWNGVSSSSDDDSLILYDHDLLGSIKLLGFWGRSYSCQSSIMFNSNESCLTLKLKGVKLQARLCAEARREQQTG